MCLQSRQERINEADVALGSDDDAEHKRVEVGVVDGHVVELGDDGKVLSELKLAGLLIGKRERRAEPRVDGVRLQIRRECYDEWE